MAQKIKPKRSYTPGSSPLTTDLETNELAINWNDSKAFTKAPDGTIKTITLGGGGGGSLSATVTVPASGDQYWSTVGLLLRGDGDNNGTTFVDSGPKAKTIARVGGTVTSTAQSKFGGASLYFDGADDQLEVGTSFDADVAGFGTGDFTIEFWFRAATTSTRMSVLSAYNATSPATGLVVQLNKDDGAGPVEGSVSLGYGDTPIVSTGAGVWSANTWTHLAVVRSGGTATLYVNGVSQASASNSTNISDGRLQSIGGLYLNGSYIQDYSGHLDDLRITKAARYTANFTPPTATYATGTYTAAQTLPVVGTGSIGSGLSWSSVPASPTATGTAGQIAYDNASGFFYVATATNTWKRAALSTWEPFTPASLTGLQLWLDASDGASLYDATSGGSAVAADGAVSRWEDKSGNSRHATQATSANRPLRKTAIQGGKDVLRFDGTNDRLSIGSSTSTFNFLHLSNATVFVVFKVAGTNPDNLQAVIDNSDGTGGRGYVMYYDDRSSASKNNRLLVGGGLYPAYSHLVETADGGFSANAFQVLTNVIKATNATAANRSRLYVNGTVNAAVNTYTDTLSGDAQADLTIGCQIGLSSFLNGDIAEVIIYNAALSDTDRAAVESYLTTKWGIS